MNNVIIANLLRFIGLVLLQGLVLKNVAAGWEGFKYLQIILFPVFIILLPLRTPKATTVILAFAAGILVDTLYNTWGIHAAAATFTGFVRPFILQIMEPRVGYNVNYAPTAARMGLPWYLRYASTLMAIHLFFYFSVEAFTFVYIIDILLKTIASFFISMIFVMVYQTLFNPVD